MMIAKIMKVADKKTEKTTKNFSKPLLVWYPSKPPPKVPESPDPRFWSKIETISEIATIISKRLIIFSIEGYSVITLKSLT